MSTFWIEIAGTLLSLIYLYYSVKAKPALWVFGFLCSALYIVVYYRSKFYADMSLQFYYLVVSVYGLFYWLRGGKGKKDDGQNEAAITRTSPSLWAALASAAALIWIAYYLVLRQTDSPLPVCDSLTTALSIVATWMLARKKLEYWLVFIFVDAFSACLYAYKGLYPTALLFVVYTVMAVVGYRTWKKAVDERTE